MGLFPVRKDTAPDGAALWWEQGLAKIAHLWCELG